MALLAGRGCWAMPMLWVVWVCVYAGHVWVGTRLSPSAVCCSACVGGTLADTGRLGCGLAQGLGLNYTVYVPFMCQLCHLADGFAKAHE